MNKRQLRADVAERVRRVRARRRKAGLCIVCGNDRSNSGSRSYCSKHLRAERFRKRKAVGGRKWKPGGPGRPPADVVLSIGLLSV